ncbi:ribosome maturation factor RimP [Algiphilus sp.]|uniref:ribosome maturation factor RimP n=1 Tax=Algiphilus sp. TaxID=1872431 RepID=UPI001CA65E18|nr:ribosome maturation factor RimP [Algiphilus sp.]MBY8966483.1 ribosome maturation factor RimP [Algiphilus acroporae]MCI5062079.1 ribosome maturation factor RimP [Algiphilus sp.]MCI5103497.1 ribosome maturation factor RimP [Algiphilus sp.]MCR9091297.1 ribosome maturation factor RimP [Pseudomonadota bacterium]
MNGKDVQLAELLEPTVEAAGFELVHVEFVSGSNAVLRLYIDSPGGIEIADCEAVSRDVSALLDVEDPLPGAYQLEVSSPGLDRPLTKAEHFERFLGEDIRIWLREACEGRRKFKGRLSAFAGGTLTLDCDDIQLEVQLEDIEQARLVPQYSL